MKLRQSTAVAVDGRAILIEGPPGCGKSSLALALIDRGATLVGDDGIALEIDGEKLIAHPPENTAGLLEIRNVGLVRFPASAARACLILAIDADPPRYVETAQRHIIEGIAIPLLRFGVGGPADAVRAEQALQLHGLPS